MPGPLEGIKVVEMGFWVAGPSATAILSDWGADVVKIEPPEGDPFRGLFASAAGLAIPINPPFEHDNRGKRSVALNLDTSEGRAIARGLIERADVFVTNVRPKVLDNFELSYDKLRESNRGLVYCQITGYAPDGRDRDRPAYDIGAFWARAGVAALLTPEGAALPQQRGGMGDHMAGMGAAGAVCAALLARSRTGEGQRVSVSLIRTGVYMVGADLSMALRLKLPKRALRSAPQSALLRVHPPRAGPGRVRPAADALPAHHLHAEGQQLADLARVDCGLMQLVEVILVGSGGVHRRELDIVAVALGSLNGGHRHVHDLLRVLAKLIHYLDV
jgi:crotonobetainyl-CoA:carnitine CoA-transferase CaiB-like acyl-CoA transferase